MTTPSRPESSASAREADKRREADLRAGYEECLAALIEAGASGGVVERHRGILARLSSWQLTQSAEPKERKLGPAIEHAGCNYLWFEGSVCNKCGRVAQSAEKPTKDELKEIAPELKAQLPPPSSLAEQAEILFSHWYNRAEGKTHVVHKDGYSLIEQIASLALRVRTEALEEAAKVADEWVLSDGDHCTELAQAIRALRPQTAGKRESGG